MRRTEDEAGQTPASSSVLQPSSTLTTTQRFGVCFSCSFSIIHVRLPGHCIFFLPFASLSILWLHPSLSPKGSASLGIVKGEPFPSKERSYQLPREVIISSHTDSDSTIAGLSWFCRAPPSGDDGPELGEVLGQLGCWAVMVWKEARALQSNRAGFESLLCCFLLCDLEPFI